MVTNINLGSPLSREISSVIGSVGTSRSSVLSAAAFASHKAMLVTLTLYKFNYSVWVIISACEVLAQLAYSSFSGCMLSASSSLLIATDAASLLPSESDRVMISSLYLIL